MNHPDSSSLAEMDVGNLKILQRKTAQKGMEARKLEQKKFKHHKPVKIISLQKVKKLAKL